MILILKSSQIESKSTKGTTWKPKRHKDHNKHDYNLMAGYQSTGYTERDGLCIIISQTGTKSVPKATNMEPRGCPNELRSKTHPVEQDRNRDEHGAPHLWFWGTNFLKKRN